MIVCRKRLYNNLAELTISIRIRPVCLSLWLSYKDTNVKVERKIDIIKELKTFIKNIHYS